MPTRSAIRLYGVLAAALVLTASPALGAVPAADGQRPGHRREATTSKAPPASGARRPRCRSPANRSGIPGTHDRFQEGPRPDGPAVRRAPRGAAAGRKHKFRFQYIPIKYEQRRDHHAGHRLQRPALPRRPPGQLRARLEGVPLRVRIRLHRQGPRFRRLHPRLQVHRRPGVARKPRSRSPEFAHARAPIPALGGIVRVLRRPEYSITGELTGIKVPEQRLRGLQGPLRRPRHLRHGELHQQHRRAARLPKLRCRLPRGAGHGAFSFERLTLRGRRRY